MKIEEADTIVDDDGEASAQQFVAMSSREDKKDVATKSVQSLKNFIIDSKSVQQDEIDGIVQKEKQRVGLFTRVVKSQIRQRVLDENDREMKGNPMLGSDRTNQSKSQTFKRRLMSQQD